MVRDQMANTQTVLELARNTRKERFRLYGEGRGTEQLMKVSARLQFCSDPDEGRVLFRS
jgi:hypothetical protein